MKHFSYLLGLAALALGTQAMAAEKKNMEFFYQPMEGQSALAFNVFYSPSTSFTVKNKLTGATAADGKVTHTAYQADYFYGLTPQWALDVTVPYANTSTDTTIAGVTSGMKSSGIGDIGVALLNTTDMGDDMSLHYGVRGAMSPVKAKEATATAEGTEATGGWTIDPYVGLVQKLGGGLAVGGQLDYAYRGERTVSDNATPATDAKVTGGHTATLTGVVQKDLGPLWAVAGNAFYATTSAADSVNTGVTTTTDAFSTTGANGLLYYYPSSQLTVRGGLGLSMVSEHGTSAATKVGAYNVSTINAGVRYEF